jgi:NAD(P)H-flavin reductase
MIGPDPMIPRPVRIAEVTRETHDIFTLGLAAREFRFSPGQFNMLYLFGVGEVAISMSGDPDRGEHILHTIRSVGTVTHGIDALERGAVLGVRGPFGTGWPIDEARGRDVVIVAGGIGLAPLRPAIYRLLHRRADYERIAIIYGARTPDDLLYLKELDEWRTQGLVVRVTVDRASGGWRGDVGVAPAHLARIAIDPSAAVALICGPEVMMRFTVQELERLGVGPDRIYLSMERSMRCALGWCGHCQYGPSFVCKDGPVLRYDRIAHLIHHREV